MGGKGCLERARREPAARASSPVPPSLTLDLSLQLIWAPIIQHIKSNNKINTLSSSAPSKRKTLQEDLTGHLEHLFYFFLPPRASW